MEEKDNKSSKKKREYYKKRPVSVVTPSREKRGQVSKEFMDENGNFDQYKYQTEYHKNAWDRIELRVIKGQREVIRARAERQGLSMMRYITNCISHPVVVCKSTEPHDYTASSYQNANTLETLFQENDIPYERDGKQFSVYMEKKDIKKLLDNYS